MVKAFSKCYPVTACVMSSSISTKSLVPPSVSMSRTSRMVSTVPPSALPLMTPLELRLAIAVLYLMLFGGLLAHSPERREAFTSLLRELWPRRAGG